MAVCKERTVPQALPYLCTHTAHHSACRSRLLTTLTQALLMAVRKDKKVVLVPLAVLVVCMGLALWGVVAAGHQEAEARRASAANRAADKAQTITSELRATYLPVKVGKWLRLRSKAPHAHTCRGRRGD